MNSSTCRSIRVGSGTSVQVTESPYLGYTSKLFVSALASSETSLMQWIWPAVIFQQLRRGVQKDRRRNLDVGGVGVADRFRGIDR